MHILIANLTNGGLSGGARKYLLEMAPRLAGDARVRRLDVFVPSSALKTTDPRVKGWRSWPDEDPQRRFAWLRQEIIGLKPDVVFVPAARDPHVPFPTVAMFRNMEPPTIPFWHNPLRESIKNVARNWAAKRALHHASHVIAVSEHVRNFLDYQWHIPASRLSVIAHGIDGPSTEGVQPACLQAIPNGAPWIFTAGSIRPARGLDDLIAALPHLNTTRPWIVIAGGVDPGMERYAARLKKQIDSAGWGDRVIWAGKLDAGQMTWCLKNSTALLMTSRAEACPNTVLEALAHGCVNVSTTQEPMPEFFDDAALYYTPNDGYGLARQLLIACRMPPEERAARSGKSRLRSTQYTWRQTVDKTITTLHHASGLDLRNQEKAGHAAA